MKNIGLQLYTVREYMNDADGVRYIFRKMREFGYTEAQTAGFSIPWKEFGSIAKDEGIKIIGTHCGFHKMIEDVDTTISNHKALDTPNCGVGGYRVKDFDDAKDFIKKANEFADKLFEHGMKFTYHHHHHEFYKLTGDTCFMDMLLEELNPEKTSIVLDTCWLQHAGCDVRHMIEALRDRVDILHLKDMSKTPDTEWPVYEEIGSGNLYWDGIIETAEKCNIPYFCVEQDDHWDKGDALGSIKKSAEFLKKYID